jgi:gliding motility-associated-like protein
MKSKHMTHTNKLFIAVLLLLLVSFVNKTKAQLNVIENYVFVNDSVAGFDEAAASVGALANACYGREYKVFMYRAKRNYIKQKYNLKSAQIVPQTLFLNPLASKTATDLAAPPGGACNNEDFELAAGGPNIVGPGAVTGWTVQSGTNNNSCAPPTINGNINYTVFTAPIVDILINNLTVASYFNSSSVTLPSGSCFIRLNDANAGAKASVLSKSFLVTPSNALFQYAYLPVISDGGHACCDQPGFNIQITVTNTTTGTSSVLACPQISIAVPGAACSFTPPAGSPTFTLDANTGFTYHDWASSAIDLTAYLGSQITIVVNMLDCTAGGHAGYMYFDAKCAPMNILGNANSFPAGTTSITLPSCGFSGAATICAPDGLGPYAWAGPGVVAPYVNSLYSNQCYTTNISGTFSLVMNPPGSCNPIQRVITVTNTPAPLVLASVIQAPCGGTAAVVGYTAAGSAAPNSTITFSPPPISSNISSSIGSATYAAGTGSVIVTVKDPLGCLATATVFVNAVPPQPTVAIVNTAGSASITCNTPSIVLSAISSYTYGILNYFWSSNSFTSAAQSVTVTSPSTLITLQVIDPITGCSATRTTNIFQNIAIPTTTATPINQSIGCGVGVVATATGIAINPTVNVTHSWFVPGSPVPVNSGGQTSIFNPAPCATSTFVVTNNINGCKSNPIFVTVACTGGGYPTFSVTSAASFTLGCSTKSLTDITIANPNTSPSGGALTFTILPPSFTSTVYAYNTILTQTFSTPGNYTVIVKDNGGSNCETRLVVPLIQNITPPNILATTLTRTLTCFTPSTTLEGSSTTNPVSYNWGFQNGSNPNNIPNATITVTANLSQTALTQSIINIYTLTITNTDNLCTSNTVITMAQNVRPPLPIINGTGSLTCLKNKYTLANGSNNNEAPGFFSPLGTQATLWQGPTPQMDLTNSSFYEAYTAGIYTMTVMDLNNGCKTQTTTIVGDSRNYPVLSTNTLVALDCAANLTGVTLSVTALNLKASDVLASWITPNPTPNIKGGNTMTLTTDGIGEYKLTVTTITNSCTRSIFITVVNGALNAAFNADQLSGYAPLTVNFTNNSSSTSSISGTSSITSVWSFGNGTTKTTTSNISTSALYTQPGTYTVTMYASKGTCLDTTYKVIAVDIPSKLEVPNVFTPNGDNNNDLFFVKSANLTEITALIYDRWGNKVYEIITDKGNIAWDGKTQAGKEAADGVYFYSITAKGKDGQSYDTKGTVSLFR